MSCMFTEQQLMRCWHKTGDEMQQNPQATASVLLQRASPFKTAVNCSLTAKSNGEKKGLVGYHLNGSLTSGY